MGEASDTLALALVSDHAHELADLLDGVAGLSNGALGGEVPAPSKHGGRRWATRSLVPQFWHKDLVKGMSSTWGPAQLDKAAAVAGDLSLAIDTAREHDSLSELVAELDRLGFCDFQATLGSVSVRSPELAAISRSLSRGASLVTATANRMFLERRRTAPPA